VGYRRIVKMKDRYSKTTMTEVVTTGISLILLLEWLGSFGRPINLLKQMVWVNNLVFLNAG